MKKIKAIDQGHPFVSAILVEKFQGQEQAFVKALRSSYACVDRELAIGDSHTAFLMRNSQDLSTIVSGLTKCNEPSATIEVIPFLCSDDPNAYLGELARNLTLETSRSDQFIARFWNEEVAFEQAITSHIPSQFQPDQSVAFQAIIDQSSKETAFFETFTRWPDFGSSDVNQPLFSEDSDYQTLSTALSVLESEPDLQLSVNFPRQRFQKDFLDKALQLLGDAGPFVRKRLIIEIVEVWAIADFLPIKQSVKALKNLGCQIAFDDVGAGILPLADIFDLQPEYLKLDRIFVQHSVGSPEQNGLLKGFVELAEELKTCLVAEGVETEEQSEKLLDQGIFLQQGYFVAREQNHPKRQTA